MSSDNQLRDIQKSITGSNRSLLLTFVRSQSVSLNKEIDLLTQEVTHTMYEFSRVEKSDFYRNKYLIDINSNLMPFIKNVSFVDNKNRQEYFIDESSIKSKPVDFNLSNMLVKDNLYIDKYTKDLNVTDFSIYIKLENWSDALLKFDIELKYLSRSLAFEHMIDEFDYHYFLVDDSAKLIASNLDHDVDEFMSGGILDENNKMTVVSHIMSNDLGSLVVSTSKGVFNITFVKNKRTGWRLILVTPEHVTQSSYITTKDLVLSGDSLLIKSLFSVYVALLFLFLAINYFSVNRLLLPISKLTEQARFLKERKFNKAMCLVQSKGDEIEQLSNAYSEAGVQIKNLIEGLESEVKNRTKLYEIAADQAKEANKQKSLLLSNVSHEIRTPLNAIIGYTHILTHSQHLANFSHQLKGISSASNTILGIVNDLLDFERVKAASYSLNPKCLSLMSLVNETENTFLPLSESKQLSLDIVCNVDPSTTLMIDELRIKQAISNIISNALKFTSKGGVTIDFSTDDEAFNISVSDTGVGIPKDKLETVFNHFEQVSQEDQQFGFGLGLAITKKIVELMNGTLSVKSKLGVGSTFIISLPAREVMDVLECSIGSKELQCNEEHTLNSIGKRALIVDDVEFNREILEFNLKASGFECMAANDGLEALALISEHDFDVVLTDISMPVMGGVELAAELNKRDPTLPIIAVTARATILEESQMKHHFTCYLTKPITPKDLNAKLHCALLSGAC